MNSNRLKVWASAIVRYCPAPCIICTYSYVLKIRKETNDDLIPLGSTFFKQNQTIGYVHGKTHATSSPATDSTPQSSQWAPIGGNIFGSQMFPSVFNTPPGPYHFNNPAMFPQWGGSPGYPFQHFPPPHTPQHAMHNIGGPQVPYTPAMPNMRDATPATPATPLTPIKADKFCERTGLGSPERSGLEALGFQVGDDLDSVEPAEWKEAGFRKFQWDRVRSVYAKYKAEKAL